MKRMIDDDMYPAIVIIVVLGVSLAVAMFLLLQSHPASVVYITQEQTPFQWYCPAEPKVNCSTVTPVATVAEKIVVKNYTVSEDGDNPEPVPTGNPVPTIIPAPTTTMPVPEFPFLPSH